MPLLSGPARSNGAFAEVLTTGTAVASAATIDIAPSAAIAANTFTAGSRHAITGTTNISRINNLAEGRIVTLVFAGALQLTHASSGNNTIRSKTGASVTTDANGEADVIGEANGVVRILDYRRGDGTAWVGSGGSLTVNATAATGSVTLAANQWRRVEAPGNSTAINLTLPTGASAGNVSEVLLNVDASSTALIRVLASDGTTVLFSYQAASTAAVAPLSFIHNGTAWESRGANQVFRNVAQGTAIANATDAASAITQLNLLLARARATGDIAT